MSCCINMEKQEGAEGLELKPNDPWTVLYYEIKMYGLTKRHIASRGTPSSDDELVLKNALVESSLLHTRILTDILLSRGKMDDDVNLDNLIRQKDMSQDLSKALADLGRVWGNSKKQNSPCWTLNKMLAHPTLWRSASHDYGTLANSVDPKIYRALEEIGSISGRHDLLSFL